MTFCTAINCIDGRVQEPVARFLRRHLGARWVDVVTAPGPVRLLADRRDPAAVDSILRGVRASVHHHESRTIAVVAHTDCAANPFDRDEQVRQAVRANDTIKRRFPEARVVGLWVDERGRVSVIGAQSDLDTRPGAG